MNRVAPIAATAMLIAFAWPCIPAMNAGELHEAVKAENVAELQRLISKGADVNEPDFFGTPLDIAVVRGSEQMAEVLIRAGADIEAPTNSNAGRERPLHLAATRKQLASMARLLIRHGARLGATDGRGRTPLLGNVEVAAVLLAEGADPQATDGLRYDSPLHWAANVGQIEIVKLLLSKGANVNLKAGPNGDTALHYAAMKADLDVVEFLVKHGADVNARNDRGQTAYEKTQDVPTRELLIDLGATE